MTSPAGAGTFVAVAVPAPLPELTYRVPAGLAGRVVPGVRVRVPLGARRVTGVVLGASAPPAAGIEAKDIVELVDDPAHPSIPPDLLATLRWTADYYVAPVGETFRAALPAALSAPRGSGADAAPRGAPVTRRVVRPAPAALADPAAALATLSRAPAQRRCLAEALASGPRVPAELARAAEAQPDAVAALVRAGLLELAREELPVAAPPDPGFAATPPPRLTHDQGRAIRRVHELLETREFHAVVLFGVTGSGKTEVYLRAAERALAIGRPALFLVPEIGLTPQLSHQLAQRFNEAVVVLHSGLSDRQRYAAWQQAREGRARIVVGARSALFAPLERPGLIVVDEEHDGGYKQEEVPRYHARDLALVRGREAGAVVILGSATPSLEAWQLQREQRAQLLILPERVAGGALASVELVDMRLEFRETGADRPLSRRLVAELQGSLGRGEQAMVLLNRRGYTRAVLCRACGEPITCRACSIALTWHQVGERLRCHYCGYARVRPATCPTCDSPHLADVGSGTQMAEEEVLRVLPGARVARLDRDTVRSSRRLAQVLGGFARGELDVLVGTQMIAKGHHFPRVTLVGVLSADSSLNLPDFRAAERTFQLLTQVAGRAGRGEQPGRVIVQAFHPDHPALLAAARQDYEVYAARELPMRGVLKYPPAAGLVQLLVRDRDQDVANERAAIVAEALRRHGDGKVAVLGPTAAPLARLRELWRVQILARARKKRRLVDAVRAALEEAAGRGVPGSAVVVDVDPQQLL
ncbi:MAG: primosomal protein N' [Acidobacteria bacterium]|nr:primosomal protein N' [Acidobacteriota bacterium]